MKVVTAAGEVIDLGTIETAPTIGITDYSRRVTDDYGVTTVVKRDFALRLSARLALPTEQVDSVQRSLAGLRATAATWVADDQLQSLSVRGFFKDFALDLAVPPLSYCTLNVEGLGGDEPFADPGGDPAPIGQVSTLRLIQPADIADAGLVATSVAETDYPQWSALTSYPLGERVIKAATHRIYESSAAANIGNDPVGASGKWIDIGPTNRWAMFDQALGSITSANDAIEVTLNVGEINAVALLDVVANSVRVRAAGYDRTIAVAAGAVTFLDLPDAAAQVVVTITGFGPISVGTLLLGKLVGLGVTEASPTAGITDYSRKDTDDFGEVTIVERAWAKRMGAAALIRTDAVDMVLGRIASVRAQPSLWIGDDELDSLTVYGFFKDCSIAVAEGVSKLSLTIEGLSTAGAVAPLKASVDWPDVGDSLSTKPSDNADVTGENTSKDTAAVGGVPAGTINERIDQAKSDIEDLFETYGSTENAAASAVAAAASASVADQYRSDASQAALASQGARDAASAAQAAATSQAGLATTARSDAQSASATAQAALTAASTQAGLADTARRDAQAATSAAASARDAAQAAQAASLGSETAAGSYSAQASASASTANAAATSASTQAGIATQAKIDSQSAASAASGFASQASSSATLAGQSASSASAYRDAAQTARSGAESARDSAATSSSNAAGAAAAASASATVSASAKDAVQAIVDRLFPKEFTPSTLASFAYTGPASLAGPDSSWPQPYLLTFTSAGIRYVQHRALHAKVTGQRMRLTFWAFTYSEKCRVAISVNQSNASDGSGATSAVFDNYAIPQGCYASDATGFPARQFVKFGLEWTVRADNAAFISPFIFVNSREGGAPSGGDDTTHIAGFIWEDITSEGAAALSANASAASAASAAASNTAAGQSASAAQGSATSARTAAGEAGTYASQASASASNAAGGATTATTQAGVATSAAADAATFRDQSGGYASAAAGSASQASSSATAAGQQASAATASATSANTSAGQASTAASQASTSATNAAGSSNSAATSAGVAAQARDAAAASASAAATSASSAAASNTAAGQQASAAQSSATSAATAAGDARTYSNNASASASGAAGSATSAQQQAGVATSAANDALSFRDQSYGFANAAAGSASQASSSASAAGQQATAAAASATRAGTSAADASTAASNASTSATNAAGSAASAVSSAIISASAKDAAQAIADRLFPKEFTPSTLASFAYTGPASLAGPDSSWPQPYLLTFTSAGIRYVQHRALHAKVTGQRMRLTFWAFTYSDRCRVAISVNQSNASDGSGATSATFDNYTIPAGCYSSDATGFPARQFVKFGLEWTVRADNAAFISPFIFVNSREGGAPSGGDDTTHIAGFIWEDITSEGAAASSANASAASAASAAASNTAAGQSASSASNSANSAATQAGYASASAGQAATSASNAAGSANSASSAATLSVSARDASIAARDTAIGNASASATSASNAAAASTAAGNSASAANQAKLDAQAANGLAQSAASSASGSAINAGASNASAATYASQSASYRDQASGSKDAAASSASTASSAAAAANASASSAATSANLIASYGGKPNILANGSAELQLLSPWIKTSASDLTVANGAFGEGTYFYCGAASNAAPVAYQQTISLQAGTLLSLQAEMFAAGVTSPAYTYVAVRFLNSAGAQISIAEVDLPGGSNWTRVKLENFTAPAGCVTAVVEIGIYGGVPWSNTGAAWKRIKLENGPVCTAYSSELNSSILQGAISTEQSVRASAVSALTTQYNSISATVGANSASITSNGSAIAALNSQAATFEQRLLAGQPNLVPNSTFESGLAQWTAAPGVATGVSASWGNVAYAQNLSGGAQQVLSSAKVSIYAGSYFTVSADMALFANTPNAFCYVDIIFLAADGVTVVGDGGEVYMHASQDFSASASKRLAYSHTDLAPSNAVFAIVRFIVDPAGGVVSTAALRRVKLEMGSVMSAYSAEASAAYQAGVISDHGQKLQAWLAFVASAGSAQAALKLLATDINGVPYSSIGLEAQEITLSNSSGSVKRVALSLVNDVVQISGLLNVGTDLVGARTTIVGSLTQVYDASNTLRVRMGVW